MKSHSQGPMEFQVYTNKLGALFLVRIQDFLAIPRLSPSSPIEISAVSVPVVEMPLYLFETSTGVMTSFDDPDSFLTYIGEL